MIYSPDHQKYSTVLEVFQVFILHLQRTCCRYCGGYSIAMSIIAQRYLDHPYKNFRLQNKLLKDFVYLFISEIIPFVIWGLYDSLALCELYYNLSFTVKQEISLIDRIQSEKEHKYNSADTDILLKTWRKIQQFFIVEKFEWLVKGLKRICVRKILWKWSFVNYSITFQAFRCG